jgi:hypothetical protein
MLGVLRRLGDRVLQGGVDLVLQRGVDLVLQRGVDLVLQRGVDLVLQRGVDLVLQRGVAVGRPSLTAQRVRMPVAHAINPRSAVIVRV